MYLLVIIIGLLTVFSFVPNSITPLIIVGFTIFLYILTKLNSYKKAFIVGLLFGLGYFGFGNWWLFTIPDNAVAIVLFGISVIVLMSLFYAVASSVSIYLYSIKKIYFLMFTPIVFTTAEKLRHSLWGGFSWLNPSDSLSYPLFHGVFATLGSLGVDFLIFALATILAYCLSLNLKLFFKSIVVSISLFAFIIYALGRINYTTPLPKSISTTIFQDSFSNDAKESKYRVLKRINSYYQMFVNSGASLAIMPESTISLEQYEVSSELKKLFSNLDNKEIIYGSYIAKSSKTYNAIVRASTRKQVYAKTHLIPFGEYMPQWAESLNKYIPYFHMNNLSAFYNNKNFKINNISFGSSICYEHLFDGELRENFSQANVLLNISDLGWFNSSWVAPYMVSLAQVRAMEYAKPFIYSVNGGYSAYILPTGEIKSIGSKQGLYTLQVDIQPYAGETFYSKYGNLALFIAIFLWVMITFILGKYKV